MEVFEFEGQQFEIPDCLKPPEMQCVNCWHRWKPEQAFRDTPRCPACGSTWLVRVDYLNLALRLSQGEAVAPVSPTKANHPESITVGFPMYTQDNTGTLAGTEQVMIAFGNFEAGYRILDHASKMSIQRLVE